MSQLTMTEMFYRKKQRDNHIITTHKLLCLVHQLSFNCSGRHPSKQVTA